MFPIPVQTFIARLKISANPTVLVEGTDDVHILSQLFYRRWNLDFEEVLPVVIQHSELIGDERTAGMGAQEKVAFIADQVHFVLGDKCSLSALEDREFREFDLEHMVDGLRHHKKSCLGYWTRGHSIENYLFDSWIFVEFVGSRSRDSEKRSALSAIRNAFPQILCISAALSALAVKTGDIGNVEKVVNSTLFSWNGTKLNFNVANFAGEIVRQSRRARECGDVEELLTKALDTSKTTDIDTLRWISHGHLGLKVFIEALFAVLEVQLADTSQKALRAANQKLLSDIVDIWARGCTEHPDSVPAPLIERVEGLLS